MIEQPKQQINQYKSKIMMLINKKKIIEAFIPKI
jgi:hypothetical protein